MRQEIAQGYVDRLGPEFLADLHSDTPRRDIAEKWGVGRSTLSQVALTLGLPHLVPRYKKTARYRKDLARTDMTNAEIGAKHGIKEDTVRYDRVKVRGKTKKYTRLTSQHVALLKSTLPLRDVAKALGMHIYTAREYRREMSPDYVVRQRKKLRITDEDRAEILRCHSSKEASEATGFSINVCRRVLTADAIAHGVLRYGAPAKRDYPDEPTWWATRTISQAARELGYPITSVHYYVSTRRITTKRKW